MIFFPATAITNYLNSIMLAIYNQGLLYKVCAFIIHNFIRQMKKHTDRNRLVARTEVVKC